MDPPKIESTAPQSITFGGFMSKKTITSDQLFEMFFKDEVPPEDGLIYHHFLENTHNAIKEIGTISYAITDFIVQLSSLYGTAADMRRTMNVFKQL